MKKNILKYSLISIILVSALFAWFSVYRAIRVTDASPWAMPIFWFSIFSIFLCLGVVIVRDFMLIELSLALAFMLSFIFVWSFWYFVIVVFCILLVLHNLAKIRKDLDLNIKVNLWKSLFMGKSGFIFGMVFLISSQYYFLINSVDGVKVIPKFDLSVVTEKITPLVLEVMIPEYNKIPQENLALSQKMIDKKVNDYFDPQINVNLQSPWLPVVLTIILFLTLWPLALFLTQLWFLAVIGLFSLCVRFGFIEIKKIIVEREVIA